jgi:cyclopropane fatty-acyl-phospholipid synthase-like methyltransferase
MYSVGLIDYLTDEHVVALINFCHDALRPGGRLILGNFHTSNPDKAMMDYLVDWRLIHRTEDDLNRLYEQSKFGKPCSRILWEDQGINLFAECVKD